jgi:hypothetical protein
MIGLLVGAAIGGWAVWRWRNEIERYVGDFRRLRERSIDAAQQGTAQVRDALQSAAETIRPGSRPTADRSQRGSERPGP